MGGRDFVGCQGGCERQRRILVIVKIQKKIRGGGGSSRRGQGECERRSEFFCGNSKTNCGGTCGGVRGSGWGVRVDVNGELKFLWKFKKNGGGVGLGGQVWGGGVSGLM